MKKVIYASGNYSDLYHGLSLSQLVTVLNTDTLSSRHHPAVCMTRSLRFAQQFLNSQKPKDLDKIRCVLVLDKQLMSNNYKIVPVSDNINMLDIPGKDRPEYQEYANKVKKRITPRYKGDHNNKSEERCYEPIRGIHKYIRKILISRAIQEFDDGDDVVTQLESEGFNVELF